MSSWRDEEDNKNLTDIYGKLITHIVHYSKPERLMAIVAEDGTVARFELEGDCCSTSYYTDTSQFEELLGSKLTKIEHRFSHAEDVNPNDDGGDVFRWHFLVFVTNKGHVTIDWRNRSNGYYDGWVNIEIYSSEEAKNHLEFLPKDFDPIAV